MAYTMQNGKISCRGGLMLNSTSQELLSMPGAATRLQNFECISSGGYRRINGYTAFGTNPVPGSGVIKGIHIFNNSILIARGDNLYHTFDTTTWVQVNKVVTDADYATIEAASATALDSNATKVRIDSYSNGTSEEDQTLVAVNGYDYAMYLKINGTSHTDATYTFDFLDDVTTGTPQGCKYVVQFRDQFYISGQDETPSTVYVSTLFDPTTWNGTASLQISTADPVTGMYPFRENMIIFCEKSIFTLSGVPDNNASLQPITRNIGCVANDSIQEINGDLIYLAQDGLRTLAATDRIDDVEISTVSANIQPVIDDIIADIGSFEFHSVVLRNSSQYRLYYQKEGTGIVSHEGIVGTLVADETGAIGWSWSTTKRLSAKHVVEGLYGGVYVSLMATKDNGILYQHDVTNLFDGDQIVASYQTPFFDLGDPSIRKNLHSVRSYIKAEGAVDIRFYVKYTEKSNELPHQPVSYSIDDLTAASSYGVALYNDVYVYNSPIINDKVVNIEGSGFTMAFSYYSTSTDNEPYVIHGFNVNFTASGKV